METIKRLVAAIFDFLQGIVVILAIMVMIYLFIMSPQEINGASMEPNFHNGEYILTKKIEYKLKNPKRGDVIIFKSPRTYISGGSYLREGDEIIVPEGQYFVSGDNRGHSSDSREFGPIPKEDFIGKAFLRYWPFSDAGVIAAPSYSLN